MTRDEFIAAVAEGQSGTFKVEDEGRVRVITIEAHDAEVLKAYIAQPMKDKEPDDIIAERELAIEHLSQLYPDKEIEILDTYDQTAFDESPLENKQVYFLGRALQKLAEANVIYFVDGWQNARGCSIEHLIAQQYGIEIAYDGESADEDSSNVEAEAAEAVAHSLTTVPPLV